MLKVVAETPVQQEQAETIAAALYTTVIPVANVAEEAAQILVWVSDQGVGLRLPGRTLTKPVYVDFLSSVMTYRQRHMAIKNELIAKAIGLKTNQLPTVIDATAGFGRDAFVLAALGCQVTMLEQHTVVALMLKSGLERARKNSSITSIIARMSLFETDAVRYLLLLNAQQRPDVIYLDPMFPVRQKSAQVKKDMQALHLLLKHDTSGDLLLMPALDCARKRVVVKRPRNAPNLANIAPQLSFNGKSSRFDVYLTT